MRVPVPSRLNRIAPRLEGRDALYYFPNPLGWAEEWPGLRPS
jgi:hypothetical protein